MPNFFQKISRGVTKFGNKVAAGAPKLFSKISNGLNTASGVLNSIASNPITMALAPEFSAASMVGSALTKQASQISNPSSYSGGVKQVSQQLLNNGQSFSNNVSNALQRTQPPSAQPAINYV